MITTFYSRRFYAFLAVLLHALIVVANDIVAAGGLNITGAVLLNPVRTIINLTACFVTFGFTHLILAALSAVHAMPIVS